MIPDLPVPDFSGRTAILGGTFNPVHIGHLRLGLEVAEGLGLARVELTPCAVPPHKSGKGLLPFELREAFLRAAIEEPEEERLSAQNKPVLAVSTLEVELDSPSYTANLVRAWAEIHGEAPLFVLGDEDFACLNSWRDGLSLPNITDFVVVSRSGTGARLFTETLRDFWPGVTAYPFPAGPEALYANLSTSSATPAPERIRSCVFLSLPHLDISASQVRFLWSSGRSVRYLVPDPVQRLMHVHQTELRRVWTD